MHIHVGSQWQSHDWTGLLCTSTHNNCAATCMESRLPCCDACGHLRDVMAEEMKMTPSSGADTDGVFNSSRNSPSVMQ